MDKDMVIQCIVEAALDDAMGTETNQIFLSSSIQESEKIQANVADLANSNGLNLSGNPFILPNGATLSFLLTDSRVSDGHSGNVYAINCFDEKNLSNFHRLVSSWTILKKHKAVFLSIE